MSEPDPTDVAAAGPPPGAPAAPASAPYPGWRLALLTAPFVIQTAGHVIGTAFSPALLAEAPLALVALSPLPRHLVLAAGKLDALPYAAVGAASMLFADPFLYVLGRERGRAAIDLVTRRAPRAARLLRWFERLFRRVGPLLVALSPGPLVCTLAGMERMRPWLFVTANLAGTFFTLLGLREVGDLASGPVGFVRELVETNVTRLTVVTVVAVALYLVLERRRAATANREARERDRDVAPPGPG
ncbi:MAG: hypothetical protein IT376_18970 [Polyangiaceae bacterium]|nr:hypothetical protein [Polyangiaceae bacterium]